MMQSPRRSRSQIFTQGRSPRHLAHSLATPTVETSIRSRNPRTHRSLDIPTTAEIFTQGQSPRHLAHSLATPTVEVTSVTGTGTRAATRPSPGRRQEAAAAVEAATAPVTTATEAVEAATTPVRTGMDLTAEGALDPAQMDISMVEAATTHMATSKAPRWRRSCPPSSPWWWSRWWAPPPPTSSATAGGIALERTYQRASEDVEVPREKLGLRHGPSPRPCGKSPSFLASFTSLNVSPLPLDIDQLLSKESSSPNPPPNVLRGFSGEIRRLDLLLVQMHRMSWMHRYLCVH